MDGVLIDARDWHYEALNRALSLFGTEISQYDHKVTYDGLPTRTKLDMLSRERGFPVQLHDFINQLKQRYTVELIATRCRPTFFHEYALARLKREGYQIAVCSNSVRPTVDMMMDHSALSPYLDLTLSNDDVQQCKPDPEIYEMAMQRLGVAPEQCLIVEDNEHGIQAAKASGAYVYEVDRVEQVNYWDISQQIARFAGGGKP